MKLQRREKILLNVSVGLIVLTGLWFLLFSGDPRSPDQLLADQDKFTAEISNKGKLIETGDRDAKRLADWQRRALPADPVKSRSLYQEWLRKLAESAKFQQASLVAQDAGSAVHRDQFTRVSITLTGQAKLPNLVDFMYRFYAAGYLHQIRKFNVKPVQGSGGRSSGDLQVNLVIEALSMPTAQAKNELPKIEPSKDGGLVTKLAKLEDYGSIAKRDFPSQHIRRRQL